MKELRLAFDDKEIGMLKIALSDDDDPNALEDVGKDVVFLIANDGLVADWDRIKTECLGLLNKPERFEPISNSFFAVHDQGGVGVGSSGCQTISRLRRCQVRIPTGHHLLFPNEGCCDCVRKLCPDSTGESRES